MVTRKRPPRSTEPPEAPPEVIEPKREIGPVPPLDPIPPHLDPAQREAPPRASTGPDAWVLWGSILVAILFLALIWYVIWGGHHA